MSSLEAQLHGRPTHRAHKELSGLVAELEASLAEERRRKREPLWPVQHVPKHASPTAEAIARDKALAKAGGVDVDTMAPAERDALLTDVCRQLSVQSVHSVRDAVSKLSAVASKNPALETFVRATRTIVEEGAAYGQRPGGGGGTSGSAERLMTPRWLLSQLRQWATERIELAELRVLREALAAQLGRVHQVTILL